MYEPSSRSTRIGSSTDGAGTLVFAILPAHWRRRRIAPAAAGLCLPILQLAPEPGRTSKNIMDTATVTHNTGTITNKEVEETLKAVIQSLIDGQEGFKSIGEDLKDATLKQYFLAESLRRASFRGDLETALHQAGVHDVKESGTMGGAIRRTWGDLKAKVGGSDHTLLETAESGEDAVKKAYKEALDKELPLPLHEMLSTQYAQIQTSHDYVK